MTWKTILSFMLVATLLTILVGWLIMTGILPIQQTIRFNEAERHFMNIWIGLAIALGLILPSIAWLVWRRNPQPRRILDLYLSVLIIQIMTEQVFSNVAFPSLVVTIGTLYTAFRLWQLWRGQQLIRQAAWDFSSHKWMSGLLWILGLFWGSNLIMLFTLAWPSVLG
jgi:chromate transport protein ChrA